MTSNISQDINILDNEILTKPFDKAFFREELAKRIAWSSKDFRLEGAELRVTADQPATSGADLSISVNKRRLSPMRWEAFDTSEKTERHSITGDVLNGVNDFVITYNAPNHVFQEAAVQITVTIVLIFRTLSVDGTDDTTPADEGGLQDKQFLEKIANGIKEHTKLLLVVGVAVGVGITVLRFWNQISGVNGFSRVANFIRK